jgi:hypothetical protein
MNKPMGIIAIVAALGLIAAKVAIMTRKISNVAPQRIN